jgi:hypothetical protein
MGGRILRQRASNTGLRASLSDVLDAEAVHMARRFETADNKAATAASIDKRPAQFHGR